MKIIVILKNNKASLTKYFEELLMYMYMNYIYMYIYALMPIHILKKLCMIQDWKNSKKKNAYLIYR